MSTAKLNRTTTLVIDVPDSTIQMRAYYLRPGEPFRVTQIMEELQEVPGRGERYAVTCRGPLILKGGADHAIRQANKRFGAAGISLDDLPQEVRGYLSGPDALRTATVRTEEN